MQCCHCKEPPYSQEILGSGSLCLDLHTGTRSTVSVSVSSGVLLLCFALFVVVKMQTSRVRVHFLTKIFK